MSEPRHVPAILLSLLVLTATVDPALSPLHAQTPLQQHRENLRRGVSSALLLRGQVEDVRNGMVYTTIPTSGPGKTLNDDDVLRVQLGGRSFPARFVTAEHYARLAGDASALGMLDVDVLCTADGRGALVVIPLGGDLRDVVRLTAAMPVQVVRP
jgi:hypothetical protein